MKNTTSIFTIVAVIVLIASADILDAAILSPPQSGRTQGSGTSGQSSSSGSGRRIPGYKPPTTGSSTVGKSRVPGGYSAAGARRQQGSGSTNQGSGTTDGSGQRGSDNQQQNQQSAAFQQIITQIRTNENAINQLYISIPVGFPQRQLEHMNKIEELKTTNQQLSEKLNEVAVTEIQTNPGNTLAMEMVASQLNLKINPNKDSVFDPDGALKLVDAMMKSGLEESGQVGRVRFPEIAYLGFRASFMTHNFDRAKTMLAKIEATGIALDPAIKPQVTDAEEKWKRESELRKLESDADDLPRVKFETTAGDFVVELYENHAPQTVGNFISLVEKRLYDDLEFFLVKPGDFALTGCQFNNATGDAGYKIPCECYQDEIRHTFAGTLGMQNQGRDTGSSQFFISYQPNSQFDGQYTTFGRVLEGMDSVYKLKPANHLDVVNSGEPTKIIKATVIRKRAHEYAPTRVAANTPETPAALPGG